MLLGAGREFASGFPKRGGHFLKILHFVSMLCGTPPRDLKTVIHDSLMTVDAPPPAHCLARETAEAGNDQARGFGPAFSHFSSPAPLACTVAFNYDMSKSAAISAELTGRPFRQKPLFS